MPSMNAHIETVKLGSRSIFLYVWIVWLVVTAGFANGISVPGPILARLSLLAVWCLCTAAWINFTYGEIGESGLRYRRLWGWSEARWSEIDDFHRSSVFGGVSVTLRYAPKFRRTLRFAGGFPAQTESASDQSSTLDRYNAICKEWRHKEVAKPDFL